MLVQTLEQAQAIVEHDGDLEGFVGEGGRHEPEDVRRQLNISERSCRSLLASLGYSFHIESTTVANLPTSGSDGYVIVPWPSDSEGNLGAEVLAVHAGYGTDLWPLDQVSWAQRRTFQRGGCMYWVLKSLPHAEPDALDTPVAGEIAILPVPNGGQYVVDFVKTLPELTEDDDVFIGEPDWHRWRNLDAVVTLVGVRDGDDSGRAQWAATQLAATEARIRAHASSIKRGPKATPRRRPRGR